MDGVCLDGLRSPSEVPAVFSPPLTRQLEVLGLISHLAVADLEDKTYTLKQLREFKALLAAAGERGWALPLSHISNSAALWELKEAHLGLVRPGLMLYGSPPAPDRPPPVALRPVMSLTTQVLQLKRLPPGSSISYGCTHTTSDWCDLAVLPVGYCNGYNRLLSNRGEVLIRGRRAPIRGRVCMNLTMVEVTRIPQVNPGEVVTLLGEDGGERITGEAEMNHRNVSSTLKKEGNVLETQPGFSITMPGLRRPRRANAMTMRWSLYVQMVAGCIAWQG